MDFTMDLSGGRQREDHGLCSGGGRVFHGEDCFCGEVIKRHIAGGRPLKSSVLGNSPTLRVV